MNRSDNRRIGTLRRYGADDFCLLPNKIGIFRVVRDIFPVLCTVYAVLIWIDMLGHYLADIRLRALKKIQVGLYGRATKGSLRRKMHPKTAGNAVRQFPF